MGIYDVDLYKKLEECTDLTYYARYLAGPMNCNLDLSACTKLKCIFSSVSNSTIIVPENCETVSLDRESAPNLRQCTSLREFSSSWTSWNQSDLESFLGSCDSLNKLSKMTLRFNNELDDEVTVDFGDLDNFSTVQELTISGVYNAGLKTYDRVTDVTGLDVFTGLTHLIISDTSLKSTPTMPSGDKLKIVEIYNDKINDIASLKSLTSLEKLYLYNNQISNLYALKNLTKLNTLNLANNIFSDTSADNEGKSFNNLSLLADLNRNGALRNLDLSGCDNITNFGPLQASDLTWATRTGF